MGHWRSDSTRYHNNQRQKELDREERSIREDVRRTLLSFADAAPGTEFEAMAFDTYEIVRRGTLIVQFEGDSRELDPSWRRGFTVSAPVPTPDDFDEDEMEGGPPRLPSGWYEQQILRQMLDQATDFEGQLTPTSFDPDWLLGMRIRVLREEIAGKDFVLAAVRCKREDGWMVVLRRQPQG